MVYSAFLLGFLGSMHCFVMCGPISLLLPGDKSKQYRFLLGKLVYNFGRIVTYAILGVLVGFLGEQAGFYIPQKIIFLVLGSVLLAYLIMPAHYKNHLSIQPGILRLTNFVRKAFSRLTQKKGFVSQFGFGLINGLIPCGLVYAALSGAFVTSSLTESMLFMVFFGLGTVPMMMSFGVLGSYLSRIRSIPPKTIYTISYLVLAVFMIYKGLSLPSDYYVNSPDITICKMP